MSDFNAEAFGLPSADSLPDDAGLDQAVPDALADDLEAYAEHATQRDAHLSEDADPDAELDTDDQDQQPTGKSPRGHVPIGALQAERAQRQQLQAELEAHRQQVQQLQAYQAQVQQFLAQQQQAQAEQIPNFEDDPQGHLEARLQQQQQQMAQVQQQLHQQAMHQQLQQEIATITPSLAAAEKALCSEVGSETYDAAYQFVHQRAQARLQQMYPGASAEQLATTERTATVAFVRDCQAQGLDPARLIFSKAQELGFVAPGQRVPRRTAPTTLSTISGDGRAPDEKGRLTAKDIGSMPQDEFDKLFESMRDTQRPQF